MSGGRPRPGAAVAALVLIALTACSTPTPTTPPPPSATDTGATSPRPSASPSNRVATPTPTTVEEPTTTNTLPPPPAPTAPAPTRSKNLTKKSLPVPAGWRTSVTEGGREEGYQGNGTWVHGRDPRYAAFETITTGCAPVTRDDYPDPVAALEGTYTRRGEPGIGLTLQFSDADRASAYFTVYRAQVARCRNPDVLKAVVESSSASTLVDRRSYPDGEWTEVVRQTGSRLTIVLLSDPDHEISSGAITALLAQIDRTNRR